MTSALLWQPVIEKKYHWNTKNNKIVLDVIFIDKSTISFFLNSFHYQAQESNVVYIFQPLHNKAKNVRIRQDYH